MGKSLYSKEINRRLGERIEIRYGTKKAIWLVIIITFFLNLFYFLIVWQKCGVETSYQFLLEFFLLSVVLQAIIYGSFWFLWRFYEIPEEIYDEQQEEIKNLNLVITPQEDILNISLEDDEWIDNDTQNKWIRLIVHNKEVSSITNCVANITEFKTIDGDDKQLSLPILLHFMGQDSKSGVKIERDGKKFLDVAYSVREYLRFDFAAYEPVSVYRGKGIYRITISINGFTNNEDRKPYMTSGIITYDYEDRLTFERD